VLLAVAVRCRCCDDHECAAAVKCARESCAAVLIGCNINAAKGAPLTKHQTSQIDNHLLLSPCFVFTLLLLGGAVCLLPLHPLPVLRDDLVGGAVEASGHGAVGEAYTKKTTCSGLGHRVWMQQAPRA
jgi:hypothetical protein